MQVFPDCWLSNKSRKNRSLTIAHFFSVTKNYCVDTYEDGLTLKVISHWNDIAKHIDIYLFIYLFIKESSTKSSRSEQALLDVKVLYAHYKHTHISSTQHFPNAVY